MSKQPFRVGRSFTGLGLFATEPIKKRAIIVEYRGRRIPTKEVYWRERYLDHKYLFEINSRWTIDGSSRRNRARYVNHACKPNAEAVLVRGRMVYRARKQIAPGAEITVDYGQEYFQRFLTARGCKCESCRAKRALMRRRQRARARRRHGRK
jgi:hypothetical protein